MQQSSCHIWTSTKDMLYRREPSDLFTGVKSGNGMGKGSFRTHIFLGSADLVHHLFDTPDGLFANPYLPMSIRRNVIHKDPFLITEGHQLLTHESSCGI